MIAATAVLYLPGLTYSPPYMHEAELLFGLQAHAIATTAHDINGRFMPVYFQMPPLGEHTWWHPVLVYFTVPFLWILPLTEWVVRFPSVVVGAINAVLLLLIARRLWPSESWAAMLAGVLLVVTPAHFIQSRIAMDYIYPVPFVLGWFLCLLTFLERLNPRALFLGATLLGFGVYSYLASVVMMPLYLVITLIVVFAMTKQFAKLSSIVLGGFLWPLIPLVIWVSRHPNVIGDTLHRYPTNELLASQGVLSLIVTKLATFLQFFNPIFLFVWGGYASPMNSTAHAGVFPITFLVLVPLGLWAVVRSRDPRSWLVAAIFITAPVAAVLAVSEPWAIDREMELVPFGVLLAVEGYRWLQASRARWMGHVATLLLIGTAVHFSAFVADYYTDYRLKSSFWFGLNKRGAVETAMAMEQAAPAPVIFLSTSRDPYIESYWHFAAFKLGRPDVIAKTQTIPGTVIDLSAAPPGSLFIINKDDPAATELLRSQDVETRADIPEIIEAQQYWVLRRR